MVYFSNRTLLFKSVVCITLFRLVLAYLFIQSANSQNTLKLVYLYTFARALQIQYVNKHFSQVKLILSNGSIDCRAIRHKMSRQEVFLKQIVEYPRQRSGWTLMTSDAGLGGALSRAYLNVRFQHPILLSMRSHFNRTVSHKIHLLLFT